MKIADFCKTASGGTPLKSNKEFYENGDIPWLLSGEVGTKDITQTKNYITKAGLYGSSAKIFPVNTVLIAMYGATAGEVGILRCWASTNQAVCGIYPNDQVLPEYLYYFFLNIKELLVAQATGNAQPNISQQKIKNTEINLPLVPEQKRIVFILDQAFAEIDKARANAEQNLKNARELFDSYLNQVFTQRGENWNNKKKLGDISELITKGTTPTSVGFKFTETGINFVKVESITSSGQFLQNKFAAITDECNESLKRSQLKEGDVLFSIAGALGRTALVPLEILPANTNQALAIIRLKAEVLINKRYLLLALMTGDTMRQVEKHRGGAAQQNLSLGQLKSFEIPLPTIPEQKRIVAIFEELKISLRKIEKVYEAKSSALDDLKTSILQKAFSGELTQNEGQAT